MGAHMLCLAPHILMVMSARLEVYIHLYVRDNPANAELKIKRVLIFFYFSFQSLFPHPHMHTLLCLKSFPKLLLHSFPCKLGAQINAHFNPLLTW